MLLIIQNGYIVPHISRYLDEDYEIVKSYEVNVSDFSIEKYSIVILLGGYPSVTKIKDYEYLINVTKLIKKCLLIKKPLLGICLGCQLIAYTLGCKIESTTLRVGHDAKILGYDNIFRYHNDYVVPNSSITVLEYFESMPYFFKYSNHVYGVQCHPDMAPECVIKYCGLAETADYSKKNIDLINSKNSAIIKHLLNLLRKN